METPVEEKLLGLLLRDESKVLQVRESVVADYFLNPHTRTIYAAVLGYYEGATHVPTIPILKTLLAKSNPETAELLHGVVDRITATPDPESGNHVGFYVNELQEAWQAKTMQDQMLEAIGKLKSKDVNGAKEILQRESLTTRDKAVEGDLGLDFTAVALDLDYRAKNWKLFQAIPMGFQSLDLATHGHGKKELVVVVGGTGVGKSLILGQVGVNVAKAKKKVLLVTVENDKRSYMNRLYANISQVPYYKFKTAQLEREDKEKWFEAMGFLPEDFCFKVVEFPEGCSARDIWFYMKGQREHFDYLIVDQITNMNPNVAKDLKPMSWTWFGQIAMDLKRLAAYAYDGDGVPVLSAAQAAGGTIGKKELTTDDIAMAKIIAHHAHGVLFVTREETEYNMGASKWRDAKVDTFPVFPEFKYWSISETPLGMGGMAVDLSRNAPLDEVPEADLVEMTAPQAAAMTAAIMEGSTIPGMGDTVPDDEPPVSGPPPIAEDEDNGL